MSLYWGETEGLLKFCFLHESVYLILITSKRGHRLLSMCPLCSRSLKTGMRKNSQEKVQRRCQLKLNREIGIYISPRIYSDKQIRSWTKSKRGSAGELYRSYNMENSNGEKPEGSLTGFQQSQQASSSNHKRMTLQSLCVYNLNLNSSVCWNQHILVYQYVILEENEGISSRISRIN